MALPDAVIGAGTVSSSEAYEAAVQAGADFIVSRAPRTSFIKQRLRTVPFLPGAVTGSEVLRAREWGYATLKFFPPTRSAGRRRCRRSQGPSQTLWCPRVGDA